MPIWKVEKTERPFGSRRALLLGVAVLASAPLAAPASAARRHHAGKSGGPAVATRTQPVHWVMVTGPQAATTYPHYHRVLVRQSDGRIVAIGPAYVLVPRPAVTAA